MALSDPRLRVWFAEQVAHARALGGSHRIEDVIPQAELEEIASCTQAAGVTIDQVNR